MELNEIYSLVYNIYNRQGSEGGEGYNDTEIKQRLDALEAKEDKDTVYDDTEVRDLITSIQEKINSGEIGGEGDGKCHVHIAETIEELEAVEDAEQGDLGVVPYTHIYPQQYDGEGVRYTMTDGTVYIIPSENGVITEDRAHEYNGIDFGGDNSPKKIEIGTDITEFQGEVFNRMQNLEEFVNNNKVNVFPHFTFGECYNLKSVYLGEHTFEGDDCFQFEGGTFGGVNNEETLVDASKVEGYINVPQYYEFIPKLLVKSEYSDYKSRFWWGQNVQDKIITFEDYINKNNIIKLFNLYNEWVDLPFVLLKDYIKYRGENRIVIDNDKIKIQDDFTALCKYNSKESLSRHEGNSHKFGDYDGHEIFGGNDNNVGGANVRSLYTEDIICPDYSWSWEERNYGDIYFRNGDFHAVLKIEGKTGGGILIRNEHDEWVNLTDITKSAFVTLTEEEYASLTDEERMSGKLFIIVD